jgi:hypothetical protein
MRNRVMAGMGALVVVVALVGLALAAGREGDDAVGTRPPEKLPLLAGGGDAASEMRLRPVRYEAVGKLPGLADEADVWRLRVGRADAARLEKILGRDGVEVYEGPGRPWSFNDGEGDDGAVSSGVACEGGPAVDCAPIDAPPPTRPSGMPTEAEAERLGRDLLGRLGVDLEAAEVRVEDGFVTWNVTAEPVVGGRPTVAYATSVGIGPNGRVRWANGWMGTPERGDRYPLIGTAAGLAKIGQGFDILAAREGAPADAPVEDQPVEVVRITGVRLALQLYGEHLVPTYLYETDDGGELGVLAIPDSYLTEPEPAPAPAPEPGGGTEPSTGSCQLADGEQVGAELCGPTEIGVGETGVFHLNAEGRVRDDCASPRPEWGDGSGTVVCMIACEALPTEPTKVSRTFEHAYEEPGTYTVTFVLDDCDGDPPQMTLTMEVRVS